MELNSNNKLTIDIPEGIMVDPVNSDFRNGVIKLKYKKDLTYSEICNALDDRDHINLSVPRTYRSKLSAISQLMSIANYFNGDWKPNWRSLTESKYYIYYSTRSNIYGVSNTSSTKYINIYFRLYKDAKAVIDNPNFRSILDAIYKN